MTTTDQPTIEFAGDHTPLLTIDPSVSYDIYRNVHKGIRNTMFSVTAELGRLDPDDLPACRAFAARFAELHEFLRHHAVHEDAHLDDAIEQSIPGYAASIGAAHVVLEVHIERVARLLAAADSATGKLRRDAFHAAYLELAAFVGEYLRHQDDEERVVMRALDATFSAETLAALDAAIVASIPPDLMGRFLAIMLPAMNVCDRCELLADIRAHAPTEAFAGIWAVASRVLTPRDYLQIATRLGLAVDGSVFA